MPSHAQKRTAGQLRVRAPIQESRSTAAGAGRSQRPAARNTPIARAFIVRRAGRGSVFFFASLLRVSLAGLTRRQWRGRERKKRGRHGAEAGKSAAKGPKAPMQPPLEMTDSTGGSCSCLAIHTLSACQVVADFTGGCLAAVASCKDFLFSEHQPKVSRGTIIFWKSRLK